MSLTPPFLPEIDSLVHPNPAAQLSLLNIMAGFDANPTNLATLINSIINGPLSSSVPSPGKAAGTDSHYHAINLDHALAVGPGARMELRRYPSQISVDQFAGQCERIADLVVEIRQYERECLNVNFQFPTPIHGGPNGIMGFMPDTTLDYVTKVGFTQRSRFIY